MLPDPGAYLKADFISLFSTVYHQMIDLHGGNCLSKIGSVALDLDGIAYRQRRL